jgi:FkbM family methyltransferase
MKNKLLRFFQSPIFQPLWAKLSHTSKVFMNYWGAGSYIYSGELVCFKNVFAKTDKNKQFVFFDVGANEGHYISNIIKTINEVPNIAGESSCIIHCFEPSLKTFTQLENNIAGKKNIVINNIGLGVEKTTGKLFVPAHGNVLSSAFSKHITARKITDYKEEEIHIDTLDNYCANNNIENISFLKIDVEGFELNVLYGAKEMLLKNAIDMIQFEFGECMIDARVFFKDFWDLLHKNYDFYRILPKGLVLIKEYTEELEVFHCANFFTKKKAMV